MRQDDFIGQKFYWFTGEIKEIDDPKKYNRVKVFCHGYYPDDIDTDKLPWATVMMPVTSAGTPNVGANHHLEKGSWVFGFFRDGPSAQDPVVIGSITTSTDGDADLHSSASTTNKIYRSEAGHLIELENKDGDETIQVTHAKGARITIDVDNNITITNSGNTSITTDGNTSVTTGSDTEIKTTGTTTVNSTGNTDVTTPETLITSNVKIDGTLNVTGAQTNDSTITAEDEITGKGVKLSTHTHTISSGSSAGKTLLPD